jgi:uncharacterized protein DUF3515
MPHPVVLSPRRGRFRRLVAAVSALAGALVLVGCSQAVPVDPAPQASDADCAAVVVRLPDVIAEGTDAEQLKRETNAQGTGAWGTPASVVLRCGAPVPGPTTLRCVSVDGVDWIIDETDAPRYLFTTYGRTPAVEVLVDNDVVSGTTAITDLSQAVAVIPADDECTSVDDAVE